MPEIVYTNGTREAHRRIEIDFSGNSVIAMEDFNEIKKVPFFHVGKVVYDHGVVFLEDDRDES